MISIIGFVYLGMLLLSCGLMVVSFIIFCALLVFVANENFIVERWLGWR